MKKIIRSLFNLAGLEIKRKGQQKRPQTGSIMFRGFQRFAALDIPIASVIDVGAAAGTWSLKASHVWPNAAYLLLEPLTERKQELESLAKVHANFTFMPFAAGSKKATVTFVVSDDLDGSAIASSKADPSRTRPVQVIRLDEAIAEANLKGPFVVKLDTHGFEVPILEGSAGVIQEVSLFIIECYGFKIADNSLLFWEMCQYMDRLGFRLFDIVDIMYRPKDNAFWQCDAFFIRKSNPVFNVNNYK